MHDNMSAYIYVGRLPRKQATTRYYNKCDIYNDRHVAGRPSLAWPESSIDRYTGANCMRLLCLDDLRERDSHAQEISIIRQS